MHLMNFEFYCISKKICHTESVQRMHILKQIIEVFNLHCSKAFKTQNKGNISMVLLRMTSANSSEDII